MDVDRLCAAGINYKSGVARFLGDAGLYETVLKTFLTDDTWPHAKEAYKARDYHALFESAHSLKGIAGNIDMTDVYRASSVLTEILRKNEHPDESALDAAFKELSEYCTRVIEGITEASAV